MQWPPSSNELPRSVFFGPLRPTGIILFFKIQSNRRFRFAGSSTLEQHERPQQAEPDETCSEPDLSTKDGEHTEG